MYKIADYGVVGTLRRHLMTLDELQKKDELGGTRSPHGENETFIHNSGWKVSTEEVTWDAEALRRDNIKTDLER
jgi:hypothetical protein